MFEEYFRQIVLDPVSAIAITLNLVVIESVLSVDNAAVLATMVHALPDKQRNKALNYGLAGAYAFRCLALFFAGQLIRLWWLKPLGGIYLLYLFTTHFFRTSEQQDAAPATFSWPMLENAIGKFWTAILMIEFMDLAFSLDNIFAAVAFTPNMLLVFFGVLIGIIAVRFVAGWFTILMARFTLLEPTAYVIIGILGLKLTLSIFKIIPGFQPLNDFLESKIADYSTAAITLSIFFSALVYNRYKPKKGDRGTP